MSSNLLHPGMVKDGAIQKMIAPACLTDEFAPQVDHFGEVKVIPLDTAIVDALETGIESTANVNHHPVGMSREEVPHEAIKFP